MKRIIILFFLLLSTSSFAQKVTVSGKVSDENGQPLAWVNIYAGTHGTVSDEQGGFCFTVPAEAASITLCASMIGYESYERIWPAGETAGLEIVLKTVAVEVGEVTVKGKVQRIKGSGGWNNLSPIDIANTGGSAGDLFRSLQTMPGLQQQGESGRLVVRGGDSRETQVYIDDMHVLVPYTTTGENAPARSRYSPFMFEGINFSTGGYSQEYGDGLSAVLPLYTKDISPLSKVGINPSTVGLAGGGTAAFDRGSVSADLDYRNLGPYFSVAPNRMDMKKPYQTAAAAIQGRFTPNDRTVLKAYAVYDHTRFTEQVRDLKEDNVYLNATFRHMTRNDYQFFAGFAFSNRAQHIKGALQEGDTFEDSAREFHLKARVSKRFTRFINLTAGAETFLRRFDNEYRYEETVWTPSIDPTLTSVFAIATLYPTQRFNVDLSARLEGNTVSPRVALNYNLKGLNLSLAGGRYIQQPEIDYLFENSNLGPEACVQAVFGAKYIHEGRIYRAEVYYKDYDHLPLVSAGTLTRDGHGTSKGLDLYFRNETLVRNFEYQLSYTLNYSKRKSGDHTEMTVPYYASRHNASLALKYSAHALKSIIGVTYQYGSGRPYKDGYTRPYHSMDVSVSFLANPKLIVYGSVSNVLGRRNEFSNAAGAVVKPAYDRFIYLGAFISLGGKSAYDVSNF